MDKEMVQVKVFNESANTLYYVGETENIRNGLIDPRLKDQPLEAKDYLFGMEFASPHGLNSAGDSVIIADNCFATSTESDPRKHLSLIYGPKIYTPKFIALKKDAEPNGSIRLKKKMPLIDFYSEILEKVNFPHIALVGLMKLEDAHVNSLHHPPIHGKSFSNEKKHYYPFPSKVINNVFGLYAGFLTSNTTTKLKGRFKKFISEYSNNSLEANSRARLMTLSSKHYDYNIIDPLAATQVWRLLQEHSVISEFKGDYFLIDDFKHVLDS